MRLAFRTMKITGRPVFALSVLLLLAAAQNAAAVSCSDAVSDPSQSARATSSLDDLLASNPHGGLVFVRQVRDSVAHDFRGSDSLLAALRKANDRQREALVVGLGRASAECAAFKNEVPAQLRAVVAQMGDMRLFRLFEFAAASGPATSSPGSAAAPAVAAGERCTLDRAPLSKEEIDAFRNNPSGVLAGNPLGGSELSSLVRNLMLSDPSTLTAISGLMAESTPRQMVAIAAGLGQAANACEFTLPVVTQSIQRMIASLNNSEIEQTFQAVVGNRQVGAIGTTGTFAAVPAPASGPLGAIGVLSVGSQGSGNVPNAAGRFSFFDGTSGSFTRNETTTVFSAGSPVSP